MASGSRWRRLTIIIYLFIIHLMALFFVLDKINEGTGMVRQSIVIADTTAAHAIDTGVATPDAALPAQPYISTDADTGRLMIPVVGVKRQDLQDAFTQSRSGGRVHNAIDIMAPEGTPVVAVADGEIAKLFDSEQGGTTIYQWGAGRRHVYYYAHLQRRAEGIAEGSFVRRGTIIGYVGNTGNAGPGNYHLHFSISIPSSPDRHWEGTDINPYPLLKDGIEVPARRQ